MDALSLRHLVILYFHVVILCPALTKADLIWISKPENRAVVLGDDLVLPCQAKLTDKTNTSGALSYTWKLNEGNLTNRASRFFNNSLFISRISVNELGNYSCIVASVQQTSDSQAGTFVDALVGTAIVIEAYIDPFIIHPVSLEASLGEVAVFTCITGKSAPSLQVLWLRDGNPFTEGETLTASFGDYDSTGLSIQLSMKMTLQISAETFGSFECVAVNEILQKKVWSQQANVTHKITASNDTPVIEWDIPNSLIIAGGHELILPCKVMGSSEPATVTWYIGQYRVDESKRVYILSNDSLGFFPVGPRDSGNYSCVARNSKGITSSPYVELVVAFLDVNFLMNPSDAYAIYGQVVILKCHPPESIPPAAVMWYKNYLPIDLQSGRVSVIDSYLHLTTVMKADNGLYYCVAFNNLTVPSSRTSRIARLVVEGPPIMMQPPINTKVMKGRLLHLSCLVESDPAPITNWQFENLTLPMSNKVSFVNRGQELWITNVGKEWEGHYTCFSRNKFGSASADAFVTVLVPPVSLKPIGDLIAKSGDPILIPCPVVCDPKPAVQWYFDGVRISIDDSRASVSNLSWTFKYPDLYLEHVQPQHAGKYSCHAANEAGNASSSGWLVVHVPPVIVQAPVNVTAVIGAPVTLSCQADGIPLPALHWLYNSTGQLPKDVQLEDNNSTLVLPVLCWDSIGVYTCVTQNLVGTVQATATVKIMVPPVIEEINFPITPVKIQTRFSLSCTASGIPSPFIQWARFDKPVEVPLNGRVHMPETGVLIVELAWKNDSGQYECWASSPVGQQKKIVSIVVYEEPSPPILLCAVPISEESVYLLWEWLDHGDVAEIVDTFQISFREKTSKVIDVYPVTPLKNKTRTEVLGLQPATEYIFYVSAMNNAGIGAPSNVLSATTFQSNPSPPVNLRTSSLASSNVTLTWEVPTSPNGVVRMYQLRYRRINDIQQDYSYVNITEPQFPSNDLPLSPLVPYSDYEVQVRACNIDRGQNLWGDYSSITFHTLASNPSLPPQFIKVDADDPYSLKVTWQHIPLSAQNGPVLFYHIIFKNNESQTLGSAKINASVTSYTVTGLSPWRYYSVMLTAENDAGLGLPSEPQGAMTLPIAPVAQPSRFQVSANSASSLKLYWEPLPGNLVTCNITAYEVEYRKQGSSSWLNSSILSSFSSASFSCILDSLLPWTWYDCRVAAFCDTLSPGLGPFTDAVPVRTLQGASSPVTMLNYVVNSTYILLSWQPPKDVKGVLIGYIVTYEALDRANVSDVLDINATSTMVVLQDLFPETVYNVSVAAVNAAGCGQGSIVRIKTLPLPPTTFLPNTSDLTITSDSFNNTKHLLEQNDNSHITNNLASIVAGSIVGAIALIVVTVVICIKCMKYRQKQRLHYDVDSDTSGIEGTAYRSIEPSSDIAIISSKSFQVTDSQISATITHSPTTSRSALDDETARTGEHVDSRSSKKAMNVKEEKRRLSLHSLSLPILSLTSSSYSVLQEDNGSSPGYTPENEFDNQGFKTVRVEPTEGLHTKQTAINPRPRQDGHYLLVSNDDTVSVSSENLRRSRMRSENAAAIAVLKSSQTLFPDDTEALMDFESIGTEVIFNERTVL